MDLLSRQINYSGLAVDSSEVDGTRPFLSHSATKVRFSTVFFYVHRNKKFIADECSSFLPHTPDS
jgi:hypothetical protein